jgi:MFS family permease
MSAPWSAPLLERRTRLLLVAGCYGGYALFVLAWVFVPQPLRSPLTLVLGLVCVICMGALLMPNILGVSDGMDSLLDERQRAFRGAMYVRAYWTLAAIVAVAGLYAFIAVDAGLWLPRDGLEVQAVFWGALILVVTLPTALIAVLEPDAPREPVKELES